MNRNRALGRMLKEQSEMSKTLVRQKNTYIWVMIALILALAGFGQWPWAWLVLGIVAVRELTDLAAGVVVALSGLIMTTALGNRREP